MIHLTWRPTKNDKRFNLLFYSLFSRSVLVPSNKKKNFWIALAREREKRKESDRNWWRKKNIIKELYCLTNNQIVFTCHGSPSLKRSCALIQELLQTFFQSFFICLSLAKQKKNQESFKLIFSLLGRSTKNWFLMDRIINQQVWRRRSLWISIEIVSDGSSACQSKEILFAN